ncbi:MAG: transposase [Actinomycetota bacterium]|nr:transposase [Actinomycetota bacterium]
MRRGKTRSSPTSLNSSLKPLQRFSCRDCDKTFTSERKVARPRARFSDAVVIEAVRLYVQGLSSYRVLASMLEQRLGRSVSRFTLNSWVSELGGQAKSPLEASIELRPRWGGFLGIDGKVIFVRGARRCLLIGVDHPTQDIVHALVVEVETADELVRLATEARLDGGHPLSGVVTDLGPGFVRAHRNHFGATPFQACRVHFDRRLDSDIPHARWSPKAPLYQELKTRVRAVLYAPTYEEARRLLNGLTQERARFKGIAKYDTIRTLERNFDVYTAHHHTPGLPADNNVTENIIKQLNKKLRLIEGFESLESAERYVRLLVGCYRFKRFTDSCRPHDNGKAPLELAGVDIAGRDWLSYLLDH